MGISTEGRTGQYLITITRTGGFCRNKEVDHHKQYYSQSGHGTCCFASRKALDDLHYEEELWLEHTPYVLSEDQVMFYKLFCKGYKIAVNLSVPFCHLDAQSGQPKEDKKLKIAYASARNGYIFWHRFIYLRAKGLERLRCVLAMKRREFFVKMFALLTGLAKKDLHKFKTYMAAYKDARSFVSSVEYKSIPKV